MPRSYKPRPLGLDPCPARSLPELQEAAALLGDTAVHGCELSFELQSLNVNPTHPSRATGEAWMREAFVLLQAELFAGRNVDEEAVRTLLAPMVEILLDREIAEAAGRIRREVRVALPDALLAATALARAIPIVTRNRRHFEQVPGVKVRAPR